MVPVPGLPGRQMNKQTTIIQHTGRFLKRGTKGEGNSDEGAFVHPGTDGQGKLRGSLIDVGTCCVLTRQRELSGFGEEAGAGEEDGARVRMHCDNAHGDAFSSFTVEMLSGSRCCSECLEHDYPSCPFPRLLGSRACFPLTVDLRLGVGEA